MEKRSRSINRHKIDDQEDLEIKEVAYSKTEYQKYMLIALIVIFILMLISTIFNINSYNKKEKYLDNSKEVFEITNEKNRVLITNTGEIDETFSNNSFEKDRDIIIERTNIVELFNKNEAIDNEIIKFNVRLNITENDFEYNAIGTNKSDLLIRVSYSYDNKSWTYINNVLSSDNTTIIPLMGNYYDIAGYKSNIRIATNYELLSKNNESTKMYWKLEVIVKEFKKVDLEKHLKASFYLEYKENV